MSLQVVPPSTRFKGMCEVVIVFKRSNFTSCLSVKSKIGKGAHGHIPSSRLSNSGPELNKAMMNSKKVYGESSSRREAGSLVRQYLLSRMRQAHPDRSLSVYFLLAPRAPVQ